MQAVKGHGYFMTQKTELKNLGMSTKEAMVYEKIKESVLNNEFPVGTVLVERRLSEMYGVSRSPVRYALRQLAKEGLLSDEPGKGIVVPAYTLEDILEVYDLLEVLQIYALQVSLKKYDLIADATLGKIMEQTQKKYEAHDLVERMEWDVRFHEFIIQYVSNGRLNMVFEILLNQKRRFDITSYQDLQHGKDTTLQHKKIYEAIKARDLTASVEGVKEHSQYLKQYYIDKMVTGKYNI